MTDRQCEASNEMCGLRGGSELTTTRVANQANTGRNWMRDWTREVPVNVSPYYGALAFVSLRGAKRRSNLGGERNGIATPRCVGAGSDQGAWWWHKEAATKSWRRDLDLQVSSLVSGLNAQDDYSYPRGTLPLESTGRSWAANNTSNVSEVE